ncbi:SCO family protein [Azospirillum doebereinerae]|uniref:SCO family protein n=1 Tax=Azospirillum doebereinerae TaxID=92933 RepID=A0A433J4J2_9PROT|nr:SCO family protein [Azospirillum doebereinerae]RUQ67121.1 SCO family protein [Azospirillum doebereinerae]
MRAAPCLALPILLALAGSVDAAPPIPADFAVEVPQDARVPAGAWFQEGGAPLQLSALLGGPPVVLALAAYRCPNLCGVTLDGAFAALADTGLRGGAAYRVAVVGLDPAERDADTAPVRAAAATRGLDPAAVHTLTGGDPAAVAQAVGFPYRWEETLGQFVHPAGLFVLTPDGRVSRWIGGAGFEPRDLRLALVEAGEGRVGTLTDRLLLLCAHYDPVRGRYDGLVVGALRWAGGGAALLLAAGVGGALLRERRRRA